MFKHIKHKSVIFLYYFIFLTILIFLPTYVIGKGIEPTTVGFLNSIGLFVVVISLLVNGVIADKFTSNKSLIITHLIASIVLLLGLICSSNAALISAIYLLIWATLMMIASILDGLILKDVEQEEYSKIRAFGSIGAAISFLISTPMVMNGYGDLLLALESFLLVAIIVLLLKIKEHPYSIKHEYIPSLKAILKNKGLLIIIAITFLTYGVIAADDAYQIAYHTDVVGLSISVLGTVGFISILLEATLMYFYQEIEHNLKPKKILLAISVLLALIFLSKATLFAYPSIIIIGNILLSVFVGLFIPLSVIIINRNVDNSVKNTVLSIYQISNKLGGAALGMVTAFYYMETKSLSGIYFLHMGIVLFACLLILSLEKDQ